MKIIKRSLNVFCMCLIFCSFIGCDSGPINKIFKRDLKIKMIFSNIKNLSTDSEVYMDQDGQKGKVNIGSIKGIDQTEEGNKIVKISILNDYRDKINRDTMFVLDSHFFSYEKTCILVVNLPDDSNKKPLRSSSIIKGISMMDYNIILVKYGAKTLFDSAIEQTKEFLEKLNKEIESFDYDKFKMQLEDMVKTIVDFTVEQKEKFEKEVLPEIERLIEEGKSRLEQKGKIEKRDELEKEYKSLKNIVSI